MSTENKRRRAHRWVAAMLVVLLAQVSTGTISDDKILAAMIKVRDAHGW